MDNSYGIYTQLQRIFSEIFTLINKLFYNQIQWIYLLIKNWYLQEQFWKMFLPDSEAITKGVQYLNVFLKIPQYSQENMC